MLKQSGFSEHRSGKVKSGPLLCIEGRFASRGTAPSYPNKSLRWTLDLPSVLKWSAFACFHFGHFFGHIQRCQLETDLHLHLSPFCLAHWLQINSCWHGPAGEWKTTADVSMIQTRKKADERSICAAQRPGFFSIYLLGCSAWSVVCTILEHRVGKCAQSDLGKRGWRAEKYLNKVLYHVHKMSSWDVIFRYNISLCNFLERPTSKTTCAGNQKWLLSCSYRSVSHEQASKTTLTQQDI